MSEVFKFVTLQAMKLMSYEEIAQGWDIKDNEIAALQSSLAQERERRESAEKERNALAVLNTEWASKLNVAEKERDQAIVNWREEITKGRLACSEFLDIETKMLRDIIKGYSDERGGVRDMLLKEMDGIKDRELTLHQQVAKLANLRHYAEKELAELRQTLSTYESQMAGMREAWNGVRMRVLCLIDESCAHSARDFLDAVKDMDALAAKLPGEGSNG
jgi:chromosome segregation ATPase